MADQRPLIVFKGIHYVPYAVNIQKTAEKFGWRILNVSASHDLIPKGANVVGALISCGLKDSLTQELIKRKIPFVRVGDFPRHFGNGLPSVFIDVEACGNVAAKYFSERGFNNVACIAGDPWGDTKRIYDKFTNTIEAQGGTCHLLGLKNMTHASGKRNRDIWFANQRNEIVGWLKTLPKPVGLFCFADGLSSRYASFINEGNLAIPEDVAILSLGNNAFFCETAIVPISSIEYPWAELWTEAFSYLKGLIESTRKENESIFVPPTQVNERQSTDIFAVDDPLVTEGLKFIWKNYTQNIGVDDLMELTGVSRSTIQRAFKKCLNSGFIEILINKRFDVAIEMLKKTKFSIAKISQEVGFNSRHHFHKAFTRKYGMTPLNYRKKL